MNNILLSIIIPYYNTYNYTIKLLKELSIQYVDDIEVILIDDGCNETRFDEFNQFTIIHLDKNYGASYA
jgi:glycosyltransferase involved in cell wall biosynthesis